MQYIIKNWKDHQHFKDRTPPWIKLHRDLLNDPEWFSLDGESGKALISLWLIASEDKTMLGLLPSVKNIAFRLRKSEKEINQILIKLSHWVYQDDITLISDQYQVDAPETETETETETEKKKDFVLLPNVENRDLVNDWLKVRKAKRLANTDTAIKGFIREVDKSGWTIDEVLTLCCERGWAGFKAEWLEKEQKPVSTVLDEKQRIAEWVRKTSGY